jgi:hypothetical protein
MMVERKKLKYSERNCRIATLSVTNPVLSSLELNIGLYGYKSATNHVSYVTAMHHTYVVGFFIMLYHLLNLCTAYVFMVW